MKERNENIAIAEIKRTLQLGLVSVLAFVSLLGCTEDRPYDSIYKGDDRVIQKSDLIGESWSELSNNSVQVGKVNYLFVPSTVDVSRTTTATRPHWMGDAKLVRFQVTEKALNLIQVDEEDRFDQSPINQLPVLTIPIEHVGYKCAEDLDGKCTNKEEEDEDSPWAQRPLIRLDIEKMKIQEVNFLPDQLANWQNSGNCLKPTGDTHLGTAIESGDSQLKALNIMFERAFQTTPRCTGMIHSLSEIGFRSKFHYSIVKIDDLVDKKYQRLSYPRSEENLFGFFDKETIKLSPDNRRTVDGEERHLNRFSPNKNVVFHLSDSFGKSENRFLIPITKIAIRNINQSLERAGTKMRIELKDPIRGLQTGDIRKNSIVLEDSPVASGLLGYGPSAANPLTGEILHARTVMYLGTLVQFVHRAYDEVILSSTPNNAFALAGPEVAKGVLRESQKGQTQQGFEVGSLVATGIDADGELDFSNGVSPMILGQNAEKQKNVWVPRGQELEQRLQQAAVAAEHFHAPHAGRYSRAAIASRDAQAYRMPLNMAKENPEAFEEYLKHKNCFMTDDVLSLNQGMEEAIIKLVKKFGAKEWVRLSKAQQVEALEVLTPFVYVPVLIHEIGHNLGLRHNFGGSEDKDNFYTEEELAEFGINRPITYSSVMDYSRSTVSELPVMGKYDIAALRYGYAEKVELKNGQLISIGQYRATKGVELKEYQFCTDEHVSVNPNCNRFDEGGSFEEMALGHIKNYYESYGRTHFRNKMQSFSSWRDGHHVRRIGYTFNSLRRIFERYESIKKTFNLPDDHEAWGSVDFLRDLKKATILSSQFFASVLMIHDVHCALVEKANPGQLAGLLPIRILSQRAISCFDSENIQLNPAYEIVGQGGKWLQDRKDPNNDNPYLDQIDVRGVWIDKIVAMTRLLGQRWNNPSFDKYQENYLDIEPLSESLTKLLTDLIKNQAVAPMTVTFLDGQVQQINFPLQTFNDEEAQDGHRIIDPLNPGVGKYLELPKGNPRFAEVMIPRIKKFLSRDEDQRHDPHSLLNAMHVDFKPISIGENLVEGTGVTEIGTDTVVAPPKSAISKDLIENHKLLVLAEGLEAKTLDELIAKMEAPGFDASQLTGVQAKLSEYGLEKLKAMKQGALGTRKMVESLLWTMGKTLVDDE